MIAMRLPYLTHVLLIVVLFILSPLKVFAEGIEVIAKPDGEIVPIHLTLAAGQDAATFSLYLRNTTSAPVNDIILFAFLEDENGQVLPEVTLDFITPNTDQPPHFFQIPADSQIPILLRVSNLDHVGTFTGTISIQSGETFEVLTSLTVTRLGQPKIVIQQADDNNVITLSASAPNFSFPLTLVEQNGEVKIDDLKVTLGLLTREDGIIGASPNITWSPPGTRTELLSIKRHDFQTLTLSGELPEIAVYTGWLSLTYGGRLDVYTLNLIRNAPTGFAVLGATDNKVDLQISGQKSENPIYLQVANGQPPIDNFEVSLGPVSRQDGKPLQQAKIECSNCNQIQQQLVSGELISITLTSENLEPATYVSIIQLKYQNQIQPIPLSVTRVGLLQNLTLDEPKPISSIRSWPWSAATADVDIVIREAVGQNTQIYPPNLGPLQIVDEKGEAFSVNDEQIKLVDPQTSATLPLPSVLSSTVTIPLVANGNATYVYQVQELKTPGIYKGQIEVSGPDSTKVIKDFTITLKDDWPGPFVVIFLGVMVSYGLHNWTRDGRRRDLRSAEIAQEREKIEPMCIDPCSDQVWLYLLKELDDLQTKNRYDKSINTDITLNLLNDIHTRRGIYQQALASRDRVINLLKTYPTETVDSQPKKQAFQAELDQIFNDIQNTICFPQGQGIGEAVTDAPQRIKDLQNLFKKIRVSAIEEPAKALDLQLNNLIKESPHLSSNASEIKNIIQNILKNLQQPEGLADQLEQARREYAHLRLQQLGELIDQLRRERQVAPNAPISAGNRVENYLRDATRELVQAREANTVEDILSHWQTGHNHYLRGLIEYLDVLGSLDGRPNDITEDDWKKILADVPNLKSLLEEARVAWDKNEYAISEKFYQQARDEYLRVLIALLELRIDTFKLLIQKRPNFIEAVKWDESLKRSPIKDILDRLANLKVRLPTGSESAETRRNQYWIIQSELVDIQLEALALAQQSLQNHYEEHKDDPENQTNELWTKTLSTELKLIQQAIAEARENLNAYQKEKVLGKLLEAERLAFRAQVQYEQLLDALRKQETMGFKEWVDGVKKIVQTVLPTTEAIEGIHQVTIRTITAPSEVQIRAVAPYTTPKKRSPVEWYKRIETRDRLAAFVVFVVAALSGLGFLWFNNPTFGGQDYVTAFLWGFGLNEATSGFLNIATSTGLLREG